RSRAGTAAPAAVAGRSSRSTPSGTPGRRAMRRARRRPPAGARPPSRRTSPRRCRARCRGTSHSRCTACRRTTRRRRWRRCGDRAEPRPNATVPSMLLHELLQHAARRAPDAPALVADGRTRSFAELLDGAMRLSGFVQEHTAPGDRVAVVADNAGAWIDCYYGVPHAGAILTPINQRLALGEQAALIAAAEPAVLLGERSRLEALAPVVTAPLRHAFEDGWDDHVPARVPRHHDIAWLLFTSGTTGQPKGALLTHASLTAAAIGTALARPTAPDDVFLTPFPLCHVAGYNVFVFHLHGRPAVVLPRFRPDDLVAHVRAHDVTVCSLAPTMLVTLLDHLDATGTTLPSLRTITYGASPISPALRRRAEDRLGVALREGYGMTELSGNAVFDGVPSPLVSVRLGADDEILV